MSGIYRLTGVVKHYDWGGYTFIPQLLQQNNDAHKPFAEYWMGTHPLGNSVVDKDGKNVPLTEMTKDLPYLFKILDVKEMLSIQVHPSKKAAEIEFERENKEGIPLDAPTRNYKDDNHKPEMTVALGDFWLLHGFKPEKELVYTLLNVVELRELLPVYNAGGYAGLYRYVMEMPQAEVNRILRPLIDHILPLYSAGDQDKTSEDFWAARAAQTFSKGDDIDRGIFSIYLFNIVHLKKGEGIFQDAGLPHAYLEGQNVELMANSDNVLRGGLTSKHIDVNELMKHVKCEATNPHILRGEEQGKGECVYITPAPDFQLSRFELKKGEKLAFTPSATDILIVVDGVATLQQGDKKIIIEKGHPSALVMPGAGVELSSQSTATVFRAGVPVRR